MQLNGTKKIYEDSSFNHTILHSMNDSIGIKLYATKLVYIKLTYQSGNIKFASGVNSCELIKSFWCYNANVRFAST